MKNLKKVIKEMIIRMFSENPVISIDEIHKEVVNFISSSEPLSNKEIEKKSQQYLEMITNYVKAKRG